MKGLALIAALLVTGCGPNCIQGPNIQVTLVSATGVDNAAIAKLRIVMSIDGGQPKTADFSPQKPITNKPTTILLVPDTAPAGSTYNLAINIQAMSSDGNLLGTASAAGDMVAMGCNRLTADLTPLGVVVNDMGMVIATDGFTPPDLMSTDMSNCVATAGVPDEDQDGRSDSCDLCPDDFDPMPTDSDLDGLPDACDPDPARPANQLIYFEPFNAVGTGYSAGQLNPYPQGYLTLDTQGPGAITSTLSRLMLAPNVRLQTHVYAQGFYSSGGGQVFADSGIALVDSANLNNADGMICAIVSDSQNGDSVSLFPVQNGVPGNGSSTALPGPYKSGIMYRLRLTQKGSMYTCEAFASGSPAAAVTKMVQNPPTGPLFITLHAQGISTHFHAVSAESVLP